MKESISKFITEGKALLWIKTNDFQEVERAMIESLNSLENKKFYIYEKGKTVNFLNDSIESGMDDLFNTLDELYPQGIRKIPVFLLIKGGIDEILKKNNLDYFREIFETKKEAPRYSFTVIIAENEDVAPQLENIVDFIDKQITDNEGAIKRCILDLAKFEKLELDENNIEKIIKELKGIIKKYSEKKATNVENKLENMVFVKGGKYQPSFTDEEKEVSNLEVCKYLTTQKLWQELIRNNPANFKGDENRPIEYISWWHALEFCNRLSEKYGLRPVYNLGKSDQGLLMINQLDGTVVSPDVADFNKTEGFRLPTEVEWEWFARGGQVALDNGTFDYTYSGSNNIDDVAWYTGNSKDTTQSVGLKMPNVLGLYDCNGNVWEWCYDTTESIESGKSYVYKAYDHSNVYRRLKGGSWCNNTEVCAVAVRGNSQATYAYSNAGFRIVRTVL